MLQGRELENGELESKAVQVFKVVAIVHYKVNSISVGKDGETQVQMRWHYAHLAPEQRSLADHWWHVRSRSSLAVRGRSKELKGLGGLS